MFRLDSWSPAWRANACGSPTPTSSASPGYVQALQRRGGRRRRRAAARAGRHRPAAGAARCRAPATAALLEAGVRVFEWNGSMMHAKTAVADGLWARVGSTNLNIQSWLGNWELDVADRGRPASARQMERMFEADLEQRHRGGADAGRTRTAVAARRAAASPPARAGRGRAAAAPRRRRHQPGRGRGLPVRQHLGRRAHCDAARSAPPRPRPWRQAAALLLAAGRPGGVEAGIVSPIRSPSVATWLGLSLAGAALAGPARRAAGLAGPRRACYTEMLVITCRKVARRPRAARPDPAKGHDREARHPSRVPRGHRPLRLRRHVADPLHQEGRPPRHLQQLPSVLHRPAEADRHRGPRRALQQEVRRADRPTPSRPRPRPPRPRRPPRPGPTEAGRPLGPA